MGRRSERSAGALAKLLRKRKDDSQHRGGREFGNVIEPTQAQMASGNKGLAEDSGKQSQMSKAPRKKKTA